MKTLKEIKKEIKEKEMKLKEAIKDNMHFTANALDIEISTLRGMLR